MPLRQVHFIVLERDSFIARDMRDGLREACPACDVDVIRRPTDVEQAMTGWPPDHVPVIVTSLGLADIRTSGLGDLAHRCGGMIVVRQGGDAHAAVVSDGWQTLPSPFTTDDLAQMVRVLTLPKGNGRP